MKAMKQGEPIGVAAKAVQDLNKHVCWIESEGKVYEYATKTFMPKSSFINGSKYSTLRHLTKAKKGNGMIDCSTAMMWLTHPQATRYDSIVFAPDTTDLVIQSENGLLLNMWTGLESTEGDPTPFIELSEFLFQDLPPESRSLPLKLMAYKAQNPGVKIPLAIVMVGSQGSGKSLWASIITAAFSPYCADIGSGYLGLNYNGFVEKTLVTVINEAEELDLQRWGGKLRSLITDTDQSLNEKYRAARNVKSYTFYILTSNQRGVAAYSQDDRRMVVISVPDKREPEFYDRMIPGSPWWEGGGPKAVLHYLLSLDLKGWRPPSHAPMTPEKYMAYIESLTPAQRLAEEMKTADENVVVKWIKNSLAWANEARSSNHAQTQRMAQEIQDAVNQIQIRPFYSPEELALMFPAITASLHSSKKSDLTAAGQISRGLRTAGIGFITNKDDPRGFRWKGMIRQYLIVSDHNKWKEPMTQKQFEMHMAQFPKFHELISRGQ